MTHSKILNLAAILAILLLTLFFFWKILLTNLILVGVDTFLYFYPYKAYAAEALRQGRLPLWNPHLFMGAPLLANSQVGVFYPLNWPLIWLEAPKQVAWSIGLHIALAGSLMFIFAHYALNLRWGGAMVAAIIFALGGYLGAQVEHINQLNAAAWLPLLFLLYDFGVQRHRQRHRFWFLLLALVVALTLLAGHAQTVFISLFGLGLSGLWSSWGLRPQRFPRSEPLRSGWLATLHPYFSLPFALNLLNFLGPLVVVSLVAVALAAIQLIPTAELSALSLRSGGLSFRESVAFSLRPSTLHYTLLPPLGADLSQVWGEAFSEWVAYVGVSGGVFALLGAWLSVWQREMRRFVFLTIAGLVLSLGLYSGPVYLALYYVVPGFDLFRVPARWLLLYAFGAAILAGFGCDALLNVSFLQERFRITWGWLQMRWWRVVLFISFPLLFGFSLILWQTPPLFTLVTWLTLGLITTGLIFTILRNTQDVTRHRLLYLTLILLLIIELFWAAQSLNYNQPTAPQAYHTLRNAIAFLLAADPPTNSSGEPPGRFLSLSGIAYDPGDLSDLEQIYDDSLSAKAVYNLIVATKEKEVLSFNLPLLYGLHSVDGYDGGILPLRQFITLQQLFLPPADLSLDGRLREKLRFVPSGRLLSLLNTRWIITDKVFDAWIDGIFYDLQFPARLNPDQSLATRDIPTFPATAIGVVSHLEGAADLPGDTAVAHITVTLADGQRATFVVQAGRDTAEGNYPPQAAHPQATIGVSWPYEAQGVDYVTVYPLPATYLVTKIVVKAVLPSGQFIWRGLSLINQPTQTSRSVILSTEGHYRQVYSGDVKIYENLGVLPRAYAVHQAEVVQDEMRAITVMQDVNFDPLSTMVHLSNEAEQIGSIKQGEPSLEDEVRLLRYEPERVELTLKMATPGWLILSDTYYPGWQAELDGQTVEIFRANLNFRGVAVPAGEHQLIFEYRPRSWQIGAGVTGVALLLWGVGVIATAKKIK